MARNRFEGITIEIDGDTVGLQKALHGVNSEIRRTESELSQVNRLMKFNPKNQELAAQKQQLLTDRVEDTRKKLNELRQAEEDVQRKFEQGDIKEEQYREFRREVIETESKLKHFETQLAQSNSKLIKHGESLKNTGDKITGVGKSMTGVGKNLTATVTAPVAGLATAAIKSSIDFETAFAGVRKTVDGTEEEFQKLRQGILDMSNEIPASAGEIASVAEAAGQLGIEKDNILDFTRTIIDLGESTNMTTEQAANELARFANITGMSQTEFNNFGSSLVALGNNFATTESEIMSMSMRLAGAGTQIGMSQTDIAALATTMSSLGIEAEAGGTAMTTIMKKMQNAVSAGGDELELFAQAAGMSSQQFADAFNADPAQALIGLVQGLEASSASGENLNGILEGLGVKGIRESDALLRLVGSSEMLAGAVDLSSTAFEENTALQDEAAQRYATTESQLRILLNSLTDLAITIGDILVPVLIDIVEHVKPIIERLKEMDEKTIKTILTIAGIAAVIGPLLIALGLMAQGIGSIISVTGSLMVGLGKMMSVMKVAGGVLGALTGPIGLVIAAIALLGTGFVIAYNKSETFRNFINNIGSKLMEAAQWVKQGYSNIIQSAQGLYQGFKNVLGQIGAAFNTGFNAVVNTVKNALNWIMNIYNGFKSAMSSGINQMLGGFKNVVGGALDVIKNLFAGSALVILQIITGDFAGAINSAKQLVEKLKDSIGRIWKGIKDIFIGYLTLIGGYLTQSFNNIKNIFKDSLTVIGGFLTQGFNNFMNIFNKKIPAMVGKLRSGFGDMVKSADNFKDNLSRRISELITDMINKFKNIDLRQIGRDMIQGLIDGITGSVSRVGSAISRVGDGMIKSLKKKLDIHSPSRVFKQLGQYTGEGLVVGLNDMSNRVHKASEKMAKQVIVDIPDVDLPYINAGKVNGQNGSGSDSDTTNTLMIQMLERLLDTLDPRNKETVAGQGDGQIVINFNGDMKLDRKEDITDLERKIHQSVRRAQKGRG